LLRSAFEPRSAGLPRFHGCGATAGQAPFAAAELSSFQVDPSPQQRGPRRLSLPTAKGCLAQPELPPLDLGSCATCPMGARSGHHPAGLQELKRNLAASKRPPSSGPEHCSFAAGSFAELLAAAGWRSAGLGRLAVRSLSLLAAADPEIHKPRFIATGLRPRPSPEAEQKGASRGNAEPSLRGFPTRVEASRPGLRFLRLGLRFLRPGLRPLNPG
jgi:hypothetical protein